MTMLTMLYTYDISGIASLSAFVVENISTVLISLSVIRLVS